MGVSMEWTIAMTIASALAFGLVFLAGYCWGKHAARTALAQDSPKWKGYVLALLPPATFAIALFVDGISQQLVGQAFLALATSATIGACMRFNDCSSSPF